MSDDERHYFKFSSFLRYAPGICPDPLIGSTVWLCVPEKLYHKTGSQELLFYPSSTPASYDIWSSFGPQDSSSVQLKGVGVEIRFGPYDLPTYSEAENQGQVPATRPLKQILKLLLAGMCRHCTANCMSVISFSLYDKLMGKLHLLSLFYREKKEVQAD